MRIAIVHPFCWPDVRRGGERYAHDLASWLTGQGHEVDYITGGPERSEEIVDGARLIRLHHRHGNRLTGMGVTKLDSFGVAVLPWLSRNRYDVVHALVPTAAIAARLAGQRVVYTALGHPIEAGLGRRRDLSLLTGAARAAHVLSALSESAANAARGLTGRPVWVTNPGFRPDVFTPQLAARTGPARLLFPANAGEGRKRISTLLAALPAVLTAEPEARLQLGGGGAVPPGTDPALVAAIEDIGVGELPAVADRYRQATVTVLPSVDEAFGLVLVESLACGTPVVASDSGGTPEIVSDAVGRLAAPEDAASLAAAILESITLARDPAVPPLCVEHAQRWSWNNVGPQHLEAYQAAIS